MRSLSQKPRAVILLFFTVLGLGTLVADHAAWGDIPGGNRRRPELRTMQAPVKINYQKPEEGDVRIVIPRHMVEQALERVGAAPPSDSPASPSSIFGTPLQGTVIAGIAIALAIGSLPFILRNRSTARLATTGVILLVVGGVFGWSAAFGDLPSNPRNKRQSTRPTKTITIDIVGEGETVQLWVPPQTR
jgi:hypothetical protein